MRRALLASFFLTTPTVAGCADDSATNNLGTGTAASASADGGDGADGGGDGGGDDGGDDGGDNGDGTDSGDGGSDGGDSGGSFIEADVFNPSTCDPWAQDCPEGEKCAPYRSPNGTTWDANKCVPVVDNPKQPGDVCMELGGPQSGEDDCAKGAVCNYLVEGEGICVSMCEGSPTSPTCADVTTSCNIDNDGARNLCNPLCDPLLQDCPDPSRMTCLVAQGTDTFNCELGWGDNGLAVGDECFFDNSCLNGTLCVYVPDKLPGCTGGGCCTPYCDVNGAGTDCGTNGTECIPYFEPGLEWPGYAHVGICMLP